jgi:DinB family protein
MSPPEFHELVAALAKSPKTVATLSDDVSEEDLRRRNSPEEFSVIENVCHLRDIEIEAYTGRINRILNEEAPFLPDIDGSRLAIERAYSRQNLASALQEFSAARVRNVQTLSNVSMDQLERVGTLEGMGKVTLEKLLVMMREHDEDHIRDIRTVRQRLAAGHY